ncbi:hypothetical protein ABT075_37855 [Streptomyces sp. NPDC002677]|uniref:hypothetical protein n=1 Tax=Streptomyces sp. NPDC002677 TaxID=3154774 RepID=UPI0033250140
MQFTKRIKAIGAMAALAVGLSAGSARADDDSLLSFLGTPSITLVCFPSGQVGQGNSFTGTQTVNCSQSATTNSPAGNGITAARPAPSTQTGPLSLDNLISLRSVTPTVRDVKRQVTGIVTGLSPAPAHAAGLGSLLK